MRLRLGTLILIALWFAFGCANTPTPQTRANGWHRCPGKPTGCSEWENCSPHGCEWWGDPNGPGPGDVGHENGIETSPWR